MDHTLFIPKKTDRKITSGQTTWQSPSNIALVKYWGKKPIQLPQNASISFTLQQCHTRTTIRYTVLEDLQTEIDFNIFLDGKSVLEFKPKIKGFFERIEPYMPFLKDYNYTIETTNSFPHSSGIASSASGMSALALCFMEIERALYPDMTDTYFLQKASFLARLGSGSACRSISGPLVVWGTHDEIDHSDDEIGTLYPYNIHPVFKTYQDTILLVDKGEKQVSSTVGHGLMNGHPFAEARFTQAYENLTSLKTVFATGDLDEFIKIVESEALTLHAMMMSSHPYFILMKPKTLEIINAIWKYRESTGSKVCFTLDAGANVHVLYPENEKAAIQTFIDTTLAIFCQNGHYINDQVGRGAKKM